MFEELLNYPKELKAEDTSEELYTTLVIEENIQPDLFLFLLITRKDIKQFILSLLGDLKTTRVVPIAIMLLDLLQYYEESSELVKDF